MATKEGTAYVLVNDAMPGFTKFEVTAKNDVAQKVSKANAGELPVPFRVFFAAKVPDIAVLERNVSFLFSEERHGSNSPFYKTSADRLRAVIEPAAIEILNPEDDDLGITAETRRQMDSMKGYHEALQFQGLGIEPGTTLCLSQDPSIVCTAVGNGLVDLEGNICTPGDAAAIAMKALGHEWEEVSAIEYWQPQSIHFPGKRRGQNVKGDAGKDTNLSRVEEPADKTDSSPVMFIANSKVK